VKEIESKLIHVKSYLVVRGQVLLSGQWQLKTAEKDATKLQTSPSSALVLR